MELMAMGTKLVSINTGAGLLQHGCRCSQSEKTDFDIPRCSRAVVRTIILMVEPNRGSQRAADNIETGIRNRNCTEYHPDQPVRIKFMISQLQHIKIHGLQEL